jgi:lipopolysaccharide biosynthesis glycosyltransferase
MNRPDTLIVSSCDETYFPMVKGLILSILDEGPLPEGIGLAFIDIGCESSSLAWLARHGVQVRALDAEVVGAVANPSLGYQRAQACRAFLPQLFPEAEVLIWMDSDTWVQDRTIFSYLRTAVRQNQQSLFVTPECHYSYTFVNDDVQARQQEMFAYYEPVCGTEIAARLCKLPTLNSGFFAMSAENQMWRHWAGEIRRIFIEEYGTLSTIVRHMADQIALNMVARGTGRIVLLDPLYNYISLWTAPIRDEHSVVRVGLPPHTPIGIVHLAGGWKGYGERYLREGLFYKRGEYLTASDRAILFAEGRHTFDFR